MLLNEKRNNTNIQIHINNSIFINIYIYILIQSITEIKRQISVVLITKVLKLITKVLKHENII